MAGKQFGIPIYWILSSDENYDNVARMENLAARKQLPGLVIAHGEADTLMPPSIWRIAERQVRPLVSASPQTAERADDEGIGSRAGAGPALPNP